MTRLLAFTILASAMSCAAATCTTASAAQPITIRASTAGELADNCGVNPREPAADARRNFCVGFAQGAIDVELQHATDKKPFCIPRPGPTREATVSEFVSWVRTSPDRASVPAATGFLRFMAERFPCK